MSDLRTNLIRLAHQRGDIRPHLLPLLKRASGFIDSLPTGEVVREKVREMLSEAVLEAVSDIQHDVHDVDDVEADSDTDTVTGSASYEYLPKGRYDTLEEPKENWMEEGVADVELTYPASVFGKVYYSVDFSKFVREVRRLVGKDFELSDIADNVINDFEEAKFDTFKVSGDYSDVAEEACEIDSGEAEDVSWAVAISEEWTVTGWKTEVKGDDVKITFDVSNTVHAHIE